MKVRYVVATLAALSGIAGTGGGNTFFHRFNRAFDFHIASPPDWPCAGCEDETPQLKAPKSACDLLPADVSEQWVLAAPEGKTCLRTQFITEPEIEDAPALKAWIE